MSVGSDALLTWINSRADLDATKRAIFDKLAGWRVNKTYTPDKARAAFSGLLRQAADHYVSEGLTRARKGREAFPKECRALAAKDLEAAFLARFKAGQWAELQAKAKAKAKRARERDKASGRRW